MTSSKKPDVYKDSSQYQKNDTDADPANMDRDKIRDDADDNKKGSRAGC